MLPPHSGFEVLKRVRREPGLRDLPVLVLTARGQERDCHTALRLGADAFVTKPFSNRAIVQQVRDLGTGRQSSESTLTTIRSTSKGSSRFTGSMDRCRRSYPTLICYSLYDQSSAR